MIQHEETAGLINVIGERLGSHLDNLRLAEQREQALAETEMMYGISARLSTAQSWKMRCRQSPSRRGMPARATAACSSSPWMSAASGRPDPGAIWYPEDGPQIVPVSAHFF